MCRNTSSKGNCMVVWHYCYCHGHGLKDILCNPQLCILREGTSRVQVNVFRELVLERLISHIITTAFLISICQAYLSPGISLPLWPWHDKLDSLLPPLGTSWRVWASFPRQSWVLLTLLLKDELSSAAHQALQVVPAEAHAFPGAAFSPTPIILIASSVSIWWYKCPHMQLCWPCFLSDLWLSKSQGQRTLVIHFSWTQGCRAYSLSPLFTP